MNGTGLLKQELIPTNIQRLSTMAHTGVDLSKILGGIKILGCQRMVITDESIQVSQLLGCLGCPPKSTPMMAQAFPGLHNSNWGYTMEG